ncbi:hypothetical protein SEA_JELLYBONES_47 [Gordonia phage Jellybones]|uniref:Uncharacterized protein n=1 Tax=Gordonia phage Jellybones TaxID=2653716 RepID=A0A5Q2WHM4_9CAUD|nr:hypothetical protein HWC76_gp086 [Gordonia phage Jellybones]QGH76189.1 hypothetical protein SEA_JELLYBONES_47 [Gordonia phage Jellybones]
MLRRHKHRKHWWTSANKRAQVMSARFIAEYFWDIVERRAAFVG